MKQKASIAPACSEAFSTGPEQYEKLFELLSEYIPKERLIRDKLRTFALGADASFYRLTPKLIVQVWSEAEVILTVRACSKLKIPFTFRAAGTSLSGQAISDSVLIQVHRQWNWVKVGSGGETIVVAPAVLGGQANQALAEYQKKIGPDPASIDSAMIGGIAANNASGMCCGNTQDTYHTMASARIIFADGELLDTGSQESRNEFLTSHPEFVGRIEELARRVRGDEKLSSLIRKKYKIKNTTGYSLNALLDFKDPFQIIERLLVGSEGTLGFFSEITYNTVPDPSHVATAFTLFSDIRKACDASFALSKEFVSAAELMDRQSLECIEKTPSPPRFLASLSGNVAALLVEVREESTEKLEERMAAVRRLLDREGDLHPASFTRDKAEIKRLWEIRKGLFPTLGHARARGETILIEDVAFPIERLAEAAVDLRLLLNAHGYPQAIIFGHALQGNLHFVFCPDFNREEEIRRYDSFLEELAELVTKKYEGSLKAEHGTGRNMAPFVEKEWGSAAYEIMKQIKGIFDPAGLLNPGVILSGDPKAHISNLKKTPQSDPVIEKCTECGFCERMCPSKNLSLTPRQRIVAWREISRLREERTDKSRLRELQEQFEYQGQQTCAVDGLCATVCPVQIDTGTFIKNLRGRENSWVARRIAGAVARNFGIAVAWNRFLLRIASTTHKVLGKTNMERMSAVLRKVSGNRLPLWTEWIPGPGSGRYKSSDSLRKERNEEPKKIVYFPGCVSRLFGASSMDNFQEDQVSLIKRLLGKANHEVVYPSRIGNLCCGMAFSSKGFPDQAEEKSNELFSELLKISEEGKLPILVDTSPCSQRLKDLKGAQSPLRIYDIAEYLLHFIVPEVSLRRVPKIVAVHVPCSLKKNSQESALVQLTKMCAERVVIPHSSPCCGFAGDRGFTNPELSASALVTLRVELPGDCRLGVSSSRTCEIGLSQHSGVSYQSIAYLFEEAIASNESNSDAT